MVQETPATLLRDVTVLMMFHFSVFVKHQIVNSTYALGMCQTFLTIQDLTFVSEKVICDITVYTARIYIRFFEIKGEFYHNTIDLQLTILNHR